MPGLLVIFAVILVQCQSLQAHIPNACRPHISWAFNMGKNEHPEWYPDMEKFCGVSSVKDATFEDIQRYIKCQNKHPKDCSGLSFPSRCSSQPCNNCNAKRNEGSSCCAKENEDIYSPNVCPGTSHPVPCCSGLSKKLESDKWVCKGESGRPQPPSTGKGVEISGRNILVDGNVFHIKGIDWNPIPKGKGHPPSRQNFLNYASVDGPLMEEAGINVVRSYSTITSPEVLDILHNYGIYVINPINPFSHTQEVRNIVNSVKNHKALLMWSLGNEWNYNGCYAHDRPRCEAGIKSVSRTIKSIDRDHPIATIYGEMPSRSTIDKFPDVDVWGLNVYSGLSFGNRFDLWKGRSTKPMFFGEYGADAYNSKIGRVDEEAQAVATTKLTQEIKRHSTKTGGVCSGGVLFEWSDEWWKAGNPWRHDAGGIAPGGGPYPDFTFNEEYWGIVTIDRVKRKAFHAYKNA